MPLNFWLAQALKGMKQANKIIAKYKDNAPLNQRLAELNKNKHYY